LQSRISYFWKEADAREQYRTGISIHSHTNHSRESLRFLEKLGECFAPLRWVLSAQKERASQNQTPIDLGSGYWTPPVTAREAHELESRQIENDLGLNSLVSISDHDNIDASTLLRVMPEYRNTPMSVEWTVPFQVCSFHLGIHNLPSSKAASIMETLAEYTANPEPKRLGEIFRYLHGFKEVLIVFNHPKWNLYLLEPAKFNMLLFDFLAKYSAFIHAMELTGLRGWRENQEVAELAYGWNQLVISGGDRHGLEPNANVNLSDVETFDEFAQEIRVRRVSHIMFMPQYADPISLRCFHTFLDVIRHYPGMAEGARNWDDRTFHPDLQGIPKPLSALWKRPPRFVAGLFDFSRMFEKDGVTARMVRAAWRRELTLRLSDGETSL